MSSFNIKYTIPKELIWFTIVVCAAPSLLNIFGLSFNYAGNYDSLSEKQLLLSNNELKNSIYFLTKGKFIHIMLVTAAIVIAFLSAIISLFDYNYKKNVGVPIIGIALLCAGIFDIIHLLITNHFIFLSERKINAGTVTWFLARLFHGALLLISILIFISKKNILIKNKESKTIQFILFFSLNLIVVSIISFLIFINSTIEPKFIFETNFISRPYDLIPLIIYIILTLFALPRFYKINNSKFTETLFLAMIPAILTQVHMSFGSKVTFDNHYMIAQFLRLISYLIPLIGLMLNYLDTYKNEEKMIGELNESLKEQKNKEQSIIRSEYLYHSIASNIPNSCFFLIDKNLIFQFCEGVLLTEIGLTKIDTTHKHINEALDKEAVEIFKPFYKKALNGETIEFEIESRGKIFQNYFTPITNYEGEIIYALCVATDITKKRNIEKVLHNIEKLAVTGDIARSIAHEIRNPLTNINLATTNLNDNLDEDEKNLYLSIIERSSQRINKLITEMLESSRPQKIVEEECFVSDILNDVIEICSDRIILKQIKIEKIMTSNICKINVDIEKIKVALVNIIINAVEAIEHTYGLIKIEVTEKNNKCIIKITDNGNGIEETKLNQLFNPFYSSKPMGVGLGLISTQNIILSHKGSINVESEVGRGTSFIITLNALKN